MQIFSPQSNLQVATMMLGDIKSNAHRSELYVIWIFSLVLIYALVNLILILRQ